MMGMWEIIRIKGCKVGESGVGFRALDRGGGAPPTPPPRFKNYLIQPI